MLASLIFRNGSKWRHRGTRIVVVLHTTDQPGVFALTPFREPHELGDQMANLPFQGEWTGQQMVRAFDPLDFAQGRYAQILDGGALGEDD